MRTIATTVYKYDELSDEAKQHAVSKLYDLNVDYDWWDIVYDDAEQVKLKITGFDLGRGESCDLDFMGYAPDTAKLILANHGESCDTYQLAKQYLKDIEMLENAEDIGDIDSFDFNDQTEELDNEFKKALSEEYRITLREEYEWRLSEEQVIESIISNEYEFTEDGEMV